MQLIVEVMGINLIYDLSNKLRIITLTYAINSQHELSSNENSFVIN